MTIDNQARTGGFVKAADEGEAFWFLNTLTINKVGSDDSRGQLSIVDHRVRPASRRRPTSTRRANEALLVLDGQLEG
jgi:hypothetical protein